MVSNDNIEIRIGHDELVLRKRYEILSIVNDILVAVWFVIGSILFFLIPRPPPERGCSYSEVSSC